MKTKWKVGYRREGCTVEYGVFRNTDTTLSDNPGNREYWRCWFSSREQAERAAASLNGEQYIPHTEGFLNA